MQQTKVVLSTLLTLSGSAFRGTLLLTTIALALLLGSCESRETATEAPAQARAILKTQTGPFVVAEKDEVKTEYVNQIRLTVPQDLAPQNKWVMFEGPVLENELIAYRFYLDSRHRSDIYGKKVNSMVMDTVGWTYHDIMDWGSDILKVGESLGIGSPAIWYQDSLYTLSNCTEKTIEVVQTNGPTASFRFTFAGLQIGADTLTITQLWSLSTGRPHSQVSLEVVKGKLPDGALFATGFVKHLPTAESGTEGNRFFIYNWGVQSIHEQQMGMGVVASTDYAPRVQDNALSHLLLFDNAPTGVTYEFVAAWENDVIGVKTADAFRTLILQ